MTLIKRNSISTAVLLSSLVDCCIMHILLPSRLPYSNSIKWIQKHQNVECEIVPYEISHDQFYPDCQRNRQPRRELAGQTVADDECENVAHGIYNAIPII